jgi:hypothetical protein
MDNLSYGELGVYGGGILRDAATPIIDKLVRASRQSQNVAPVPRMAAARTLEEIEARSRVTGILKRCMSPDQRV